MATLKGVCYQMSVELALQGWEMRSGSSSAKAVISSPVAIAVEGYRGDTAE